MRHRADHDGQRHRQVAPARDDEGDPHRVLHADEVAVGDGRADGGDLEEERVPGGLCACADRLPGQDGERGALAASLAAGGEDLEAKLIGEEFFLFLMWAIMRQVLATSIA